MTREQEQPGTPILTRQSKDIQPACIAYTCNRMRCCHCSPSYGSIRTTCFLYGVVSKFKELSAEYVHTCTSLCPTDIAKSLF